MKGYFNFRHVIMRAGIPLSNETNWAVGHMVAGRAQKRGVEPSRILTEKTDPNAKVSAPHCIAHYPMSLHDEALALVKNWWGEREAQGDLFEGK